MKPEEYFFKDDGSIPNNKLPLLLYKNAFSERGKSGAEWLEKRFSENNWRNSWRNGVYDYHHYHSNTHEVLGVYSGKALLQLGGEKGEKLEVTAGDVIVIPAGVGHKNLGSEDFQIVGAYPNGMDHDMNYGKDQERPQSDKNIAEVPLPESDPVLGKDEGLPKIWAGG
ncbi:cupin domain-containing protein [Salegentibacter sp. F188]|uniref:Cupin domain-containing protein n=1 Tax=Autumnicola patrickiae TaxID=3075591 RepID=A0ABU3E1Y3_9FLAO|nr:cupin domain-containing protein [Salegentibacter sp. F188]MDT0690005.1 cupin domain-containing protein [Salegentibacter sp. F188]